MSRSVASKRRPEAWSISTCSDSASGVPACSSVANWRVKLEMLAIDSFDRRRIHDGRRISRCRPWPFDAAGVPFVTSPASWIDVTCTRSLRSLSRAARGVSASRMPVLTWPVSVSAVYSKMGISGGLFTRPAATARGSAGRANRSIVLRHAQDLVDRRDAAQHLLDAVHAQRAQPAALDRRLLDRGRVRAIHDLVLHRVVDLEHLVDRGALDESRAEAVLAAGADGHLPLGE